MLDPSIFTECDPLTNRERLELWRRKWWGWKAETYWTLTHPSEDGLIVDEVLGDIANVPAFLRRQAS